MALLRLTSFLVFFLFCLIPRQILAAEQESVSEVYFKTEHLMVKYSANNGRAWQSYNTQAKWEHLKGIEEGMFLLMLQMNDDDISRAFLSTAHQEGNKLVITGSRFADLSGQIDIVYSDSSNIRIPIIEAYRHILKKLRGAKPEELASDLSMLRKKYNN